MRDLVVNEALVAMAYDAAKCLHGLIAAGEEVPYEVREPGDGLVGQRVARARGRHHERIELAG